MDGHVSGLTHLGASPCGPEPEPRAPVPPASSSEGVTQACTPEKGTSPLIQLCFFLLPLFKLAGDVDRSAEDVFHV